MATTAKSVPIIKTTGVKVHDVNVANSVKVGVHQLNYLNSETYDIEIIGAVISFRRKDWKAEERTVYSTLNNVIFWRQ